MVCKLRGPSAGVCEHSLCEALWLLQHDGNQKGWWARALAWLCGLGRVASCLGTSTSSIQAAEEGGEDGGLWTLHAWVKLEPVIQWLCDLGES